MLPKTPVARKTKFRNIPSSNAAKLACSRSVHAEPDDVADLLDELRVVRELEGLDTVRRRRRGPAARHGTGRRRRPAWSAPANARSWVCLCRSPRGSPSCPRRLPSSARSAPARHGAAGSCGRRPRLRAAPGRPAGAGPQRLPSCTLTRRSGPERESSTSITPAGYLRCPGAYNLKRSLNNQLA